MVISIKNQAFRKLHSLSGLIERAKGQSIFSSTDGDALEMFEGFVGFFKTYFEEIEDAVYVDFHETLAKRIVPLYSLINPQNTSDIPWSLIPAFERVLKTELGDEYGLILRADWNYNYTVYTHDLGSYLKQVLHLFLPERVKEFADTYVKKSIHVFSFPIIEKNNAVLNTALGHEIGHFFHDKWEKSEDGKRLFELANKTLWEEYSQKNPNDLFLPFQKTEKGLLVLKGMYREIISDLVGYLLFGPSMLYALFYISNLEADIVKPVEENDYYPPLKYRIRILKQIVDNDEEVQKLLNSESHSVLKIKDLHMSINEYLSDQKDLEVLDDFLIERKVFEESVSVLLSYLEEGITQSRISYEHILDLDSLLDNDIPINELEQKPVELNKIILVGWYYYFRLLDNSDKDEYVKQFQQSMRLLLKSVYSSYVQQNFISAKARI